MQYEGNDIAVGDVLMFTEGDMTAGTTTVPGRVGMGIVQSQEGGGDTGVGEMLLVLIPGLDYHGSNTGYVMDPALILGHWPAA